MTDCDNIKKRAMIEAMTKCLCIVTDACKEAEISRQTHYRWMKEDEEYRAEIESLSDMVIDFAESKLCKQIDKGDTTAIIFYLKTKGKKRGYIERQEIEHSGIVLKFDSDDAKA